MTLAALQLESYRKAAHYKTIAKWWKLHGSKCLPDDVLPPTGAIVTRDGEMLAASFLYVAGKVGFIAFTVAKPELRATILMPATVMAIQGAIEMAKLRGCSLIWSTTENALIDYVYNKHTKFRRTTPHHNYFLLHDPALSFDMLVGEGFERTRRRVR